MAMQQFKKWNKIHHINDVRLLTEPDINIKEKQRRKGWKAALEMVQSVGEQAGGPEHNCYYEMMDAIDKELGNDD